MNGLNQKSIHLTCNKKHISRSASTHQSKSTCSDQSTSNVSKSGKAKRKGHTPPKKRNQTMDKREGAHEEMAASKTPRANASHLFFRVF